MVSQALVPEAIEKAEGHITLLMESVSESVGETQHDPLPPYCDARILKVSWDTVLL